MRISKTNLKILIENYLNEIGLGHDPGDPPVLGSPAQKASGRQVKLLKYVLPLIDAKEWSNITGSDRYFHYLANYNSVQEVGSIYPKLRSDLVTLGTYKEALDFFFSSTRITRVGRQVAFEEASKDMKMNISGIEDGIKVLRGEMDPGDVLNKAYDMLTYTSDKKPPKPDGSLVGLDAWKETYGYDYWFEARPDLYGDGKTFIQPMLNVKLSPDERRLAWELWEKSDWVQGEGAGDAKKLLRVKSKLKNLGVFSF